MAAESIKTVSQSIKLPVSGKVAPNRLLKSSMTERLCTFSKDDLDQRGRPTEQYIQAYKEWGAGQLGIIMLGNIPAHREHLEAPSNAVIDPDSPWDPVEAYKPVVAACKAHGSLCIGQITHAGRQSPNHVNKHPVAPSDGEAYKAIGMEFEAARALTVEEIKDIVRRFAFAAEVLYKAGADGIELHAAHGYLLSQFLNSHINRRTDQYGGSFENRGRIIFEILDAIDAKVPKDFVRAIKINSADFANDGWSAQDCAQIVGKLEAAGIDLIELSGGSYEKLQFHHVKESTAKRESYFVEYAEQIRPHIKKAVLCVTGGFRSVDKMAEAINDGVCEMIGMARPLTADPHFPANLIHGKTDRAAPNYVDEPLQTPAAVAQIHAFAEKRAIQDYSDKEVAEKWTKIITSRDYPAPRGSYEAA